MNFTDAAEIFSATTENFDADGAFTGIVLTQPGFHIEARIPMTRRNPAEFNPFEGELDYDGRVTADEFDKLQRDAVMSNPNNYLAIQVKKVFHSQARSIEAGTGERINWVVDTIGRLTDVPQFGNMVELIDEEAMRASIISAVKAEIAANPSDAITYVATVQSALPAIVSIRGTNRVFDPTPQLRGALNQLAISYAMTEPMSAIFGDVVGQVASLPSLPKPRRPRRGKPARKGAPTAPKAAHKGNRPHRNAKAPVAAANTGRRNGSHRGRKPAVKA